jgi:hypothetical protein
MTSFVRERFMREYLGESIVETVVFPLSCEG